MGTIAATAAAAKAHDRPPSKRSPHRGERYSVGAEDRCTPAGSARTVWQVANRVQPLSALAQVWRLGPHLEYCPVLGRPGRWTGLGDSLRRRDYSACSPACSWGKKSSPEDEALGRSRGTFSTKTHVRAEGGGKLITFILTPVQPHETTVAERLLEQGVVSRRSAGRRRLRPKRLVGDKGYSNRRYRNYLRRRGIRDRSSQGKRSSRWSVRPPDLPFAKPRRAANQSSQAVPADRNPLREAGCQLRGHDHHRRNSSMAVVCIHTLITRCSVS